MDKRTKETEPPPPNSAIALEIETRADRIQNTSEQLAEQAKALRVAAARLRGEQV